MRSFRGVKLRLALVGFLFLLMFLAVAVRAYQLQILQGEKLGRLGKKQHFKESIVLPKRGTILDRNGEPLALSLVAQSVYIRHQRLEAPNRMAQRM